MGMQYSSPSSVSRPVSLTKSTEAQVYGLFALAMGLTAAGIGIGMLFAQQLLSTGVYMVLGIMELGLIFTSRMWMDKTPLNYVLFGIFPVFSGITITPLILLALVQYANGPAILLNAVAATACMAGAAAVFARTTSMNLGVMGKALLFGLLGLIAMSLLQFFVPSLRTETMELAISGIGVVLFGLFTAYDVQRIQQMSRLGANPFMLALSLYLDIFNLFVYILRFMLVLSGSRD